MNSNRGFTLTEIMVVVSILTIVIGAATLSFREILKNSRDDRRIADMQQVEIALELYRQQDPNRRYPIVSQYEDPSELTECPDGYDRSRIDGNGNGDRFLDILLTRGYMDRQALDPTNSGDCTHEFTYKYQRFADGTNGCTSGAGGYYVLGIADLEQVEAGDHHPSSPGWVCGSTDWHDLGFEWVTGGYDGVSP